MDNALISIIIPAYNAERFVERAINSALNQTSNEIEVIIVNDGSKDSTGKILDAYAEKYEEVRVVHKENGGISSARNAGMKAAMGKYFLFLDADDYIDKETCAEAISVIRECEPDCIDFGWKYVSSSGEVGSNHHKVEKNRLLSKKEIHEIILPPLLNLRKDDEHFIYDFSWTKLIKREIIQRYQICFDEKRRIWEDRPFVIWYLKYCESFYSMEQCFYNYVDVHGSLSRRYSLQFFDIILDNYRLYREWYGDEFDFEIPYVNTYWANAIENMVYRSLDEKDNQEQIRMVIKRALADKQILNWYKAKTDITLCQKRLIRLLENGELEQAIALYGRMKRMKERSSFVRYVFMRFLRVFER